MYLRSVIKRTKNKTYRYWRLVETVRTERGPRQRIVAHLGDLARYTCDDWQALAQRMGTPEMANVLERRVGEGGRRGRPARWTLNTSTSRKQDVWVSLESIRLSDGREFGNVYVALQIWKLLGIGRLMEELIGFKKSEIPVPLTAALIAVNRLVHPISELAMVRWWRRTALPELLGIDRTAIEEDRLYRTLDAVGVHKERIEQHLGRTGMDLFSNDYTFLIYDLTSTYFEGRGLCNPKARRGYSRDHRPDCLQVCVGVVVDLQGFPVGYEVFDGNVRDHQTVIPVIDKLEKRYGPANFERLLCLDRGMIMDKGQQNLVEIRKRGYRYVIADRRQEAFQWWQRARPDSWQVVRRTDDEDILVEVQEVGVEDNDRIILVRSAGCRNKEHGIHDRLLAKLTDALSKLEFRVKAGRLKDPVKIERCIGGILARHPGINRWVCASFEKESRQIVWRVKSEIREEAKELEGVYLLRTNNPNCPAKDIWESYVQLVKVENVFRTIKTDLRARPIFHHKENRVEAHILFSFLAYAMYWTLEHLHRRRGGTLTGRRLLEILHEIKMNTVSALSSTGWRFQLHRICDPCREQQEVLASLGMRLPRIKTRLEKFSLTV